MIRIVHIDDSKEFLNFLRNLFDNMTNADKYELVQLTDPVEFISEFESIEADVIVSEFQLPRLDGINLLQTLRKKNSTHPFIILTSRSSKRTAIAALNAGVDYFLEKGTEPTSMFSQLIFFITKAAERRKVDEEQRINEMLFKKIFENVPIEILINRRKDGLIIDANKKALERYKKKKKDLVGRTVIETGLMSQEQREEGLRRFDGRYGVVFDSPSFPLLDNPMIGEYLLEQVMINGEEHMIQMVRNYSPYGQIGKSLKLQKLLLDIVPILVMLSDIEGTVLYANNTLREFWGLSKDDPLPSMVNLYETESSRDDYNQRMTELLSQGSVSFISEIQKDEHLLRVETTSKLVDLIGEKLIVSIGRDVTEKIERERALITKEMAIEHSIDAQALGDLEGRLFYVNQSFLDMWGFERKEEVIGQSAVRYWNSKEEAFEVVRTLRESGKYIGTMNARHRSGASFTARLAANMVKDQAGNPICMQASFHDITQSIKAQEVLLNQREELSEFAHTMAHDLRNHLYKINGMLVFLMEKYDIAVDDSVQITNLVNEINSIMTNALNLAEEGRLIGTNEETDLNEIMQGVHFIFKDSLVDFKLDVLPIVYADGFKLFQVFKNIVENALFHGIPSLVQVTTRKTKEGLDLIIMNNGKKIDSAVLEEILNRNTTGLGFRIIFKVLDALEWKFGMVSSDNETSAIISIPHSSIVNE